MGNMLTYVQSYRLNKYYKEKKEEDEIKKKDICSYLYGKCDFKDVYVPFLSGKILREEENRKNI